jgi:hypothetical protein
MGVEFIEVLMKNKPGRKKLFFSSSSCSSLLLDF